MSSRQLKRVVGESLNTLSPTIGPQKGRDVLARELLSIGNIGSRFYGGLVQIWDHDAESRKHPNRAILEFFGTNSIADVLEQLEAQGIDLYAPDGNEDVYKSVQLKLQRFILSTRRLHEAGR